MGGERRGWERLSRSKGLSSRSPTQVPCLYQDGPSVLVAFSPIPSQSSEALPNTAWGPGKDSLTQAWDNSSAESLSPHYDVLRLLCSRGSYWCYTGPKFSVPTESEASQPASSIARSFASTMSVDTMFVDGLVINLVAKQVEATD